MKISPHILRFLPFLVYVLLFPVAALAGISPDQYRQQLQQFSARVDQLKEHPEQAAQLAAEVPENVTVSGNSREYSVSYDWFKRDLKKFQDAKAEDRAGILQAMQQRLQSLEQQAQAYEESVTGPQANHKKVEEILSRYEFRQSHGPGFLAIWWEKLMRWLSDFFNRHPIYGRNGFNLLVYGIVAGAFVLFAIWILRRFSRPTDIPSREIMPFAPSARGWRSWLADAQESARQGRWRDGIHLAYWAAISFLEEQGAWRPDRARTPREYLRMLGTRKPQYPALSVLTRKFEVVWYGHREASADDFQETVGHLEQLGCR